jgi:hypothetical protein
MVLIFKTSVFTDQDIQSLTPSLDKLPQTRWNFDLEDCDKILRIESLQEVSEDEIINILIGRGFTCEVLSW